MSADQEDQVAAVHLGVADEARETGRVQRGAGGIEEDFSSGGVFGEQVETVGADLAHFTGREMTRASHKIGGHSVGVRVLGAPDVVEVDLHPAGTGTSLAPRHSRSKS